MSMHPHGSEHGPSHFSPYPAGSQAYGSPHQAPRKSNLIAILGIILSSLGFLLGLVPLLGLVLAVSGLVLALIALNKHQLKGLSIASASLASVGMVVGTITTIVFAASVVAGGSSDDTPVAEPAATEASSDGSTSSPEPTHTPSPTPKEEKVDWNKFQETDERTYAQIVKDPDGNAGKTLIIYGSVIQLDSASGPCRMLLQTGATYQTSWYDYKTTALAFSGTPDSKDASSCPVFNPLVQEDNVKLWVKVQGSTSYNNKAGIETTALVFKVYKAEVQ